MVSRLFLDLGPVLGQLCALLDGQAEQVDEAGSIGLVIVLIHAEGGSLLVVQGVRRGDAGVDHVALVELQLDVAGDGLLEAVGEGIQRLAQRMEASIGCLLGVDSSFFSSVALNATGCASDVEGSSSSLIFLEPLIMHSKLTKFPITSSGVI